MPGPRRAPILPGGSYMAISRVLFATVASAAALTLAAPAHAAYVYVGSWQVDDGLDWFVSPPNGPLAYTGQEAAALLFGGAASDYAISTLDSNAANINNMAWYSVIGYTGNQGNGGSILAENYSSKYLGQFYGPTSGYPFGDPDAAASAYIRDNARGSTFINYAFRIDNAVPEPATWALMILGFGAVAFAMRRQRQQVRVNFAF